MIGFFFADLLLVLFFLYELELIYHAVAVSAVQESDSVIHI